MFIARCWALRLALAVLIIAGMTLSVFPATAQDATPVVTDVVLPPDAEVEGLSLAEWNARSWQWFFSFPEVSNPFFDETGDQCGYGQSGPVFFLSGAPGPVERACTVSVGATLFVPLAGAECSTVEPPPYFGRDEAELRACAIDAVDQVPEADIAAMEVSVDGQTISDLQPYRVSTPLFQLLLPEENLLGSTAPVANSVADGYQVLLAPLAEGSHVISWSVPGPEGMMTVTYRLTVAAPQILDPLASPEASPVS